jgi:hypothetical protein
MAIATNSPPLAQRNGTRPVAAAVRVDRWLGIGSIVLGIGIAATSLLGPLVADLIRYRLAGTAVNQQIGADAFALVIVVPLSIVAGVLVLRGHRAGPVLALAPATYGLYIFAEEILAPDYGGLPGNNERFFPLFLGVFLVAGAVGVRALRAIDTGRLPAASRLLRRVVGGALLLFTAFMILGRYLPALADAMSGNPASSEYLAAPTLFWTIALEDLGVVLPAVVAVGVGLLRGAGWAPKAQYAVVGWLALVPAAVAAMAIAMGIGHDPASSAAAAVLLTVIGLACAFLGAVLYRPLFRHR